MSSLDDGGVQPFSDRRLVLAIAINLFLSIIEVVAGVLAGSLSLLADALHNFNDCASLVITLVARKIARKQADYRRTFGYLRAEVLGALINLIFVILVGLYLLYEAVSRYLDPREVSGWPLIIAAGVALVVDLGTVALLYSMSKGSLNLKAGFLHKLSDALASIGVIVAGIVILLWRTYVVDLIITVAIATYILWQSATLLKGVVRILMESVPEDIRLEDVISSIRKVNRVKDVHHLHIWQLDEQHRALEAHIVISKEDAERINEVKQTIKDQLRKEFDVAH